jgi:hypothetical protein
MCTGALRSGVLSKQAGPMRTRVVDFAFVGRAAHAATAPHLGRSALDAVELMQSDPAAAVQILIFAMIAPPLARQGPGAFEIRVVSGGSSVRPFRTTLHHACRLGRSPAA